MLKLKVYANENLQMPETELVGENMIEVLDPYLKQCPRTMQYSTPFGRLRRAARYAGIPMWGIMRNKALQSGAYLADQMVKMGMAEWIEFNEEQFNPQKAIGAMRNKRLNTKPRTAEHNAKLLQGQRAFHANVTKEKKEALNAAKSAGWAKRRENPDAPKITKPPQSDEHRKKCSEIKKARYAAMTEIQKAERSAKLKAGWAARKVRMAAEAEAKKQEEYRQKLIAAGRLPANDEQIPEWFKM